MSPTVRALPRFLRDAVEAAPGAPWLRVGGRTWTLADALDEVEAVAGGLARRGVEPGDVVVVVSRNDPDTVFTWLAVTYLGAAVAAANPASTAPELAALVVQSGGVLVVGRPVDAETLDAAGARPAFTTAAELAVDATGAPDPWDDPDSVCVLIPTSGTTGRSKLVMQTHRAFVLTGEAFGSWAGVGPDDVMATALPMFHINAMAYTMLGSLGAGAGFALLPRFSATTFLADLRDHGATQFNALGALLEILCRREPSPADRDHGVRRCYASPALDEAKLDLVAARYGFEVVCGYALSECPYGLVWPPGRRLPGRLGLARQHPVHPGLNEVRLVDDGRVVADGPGELQLRNPAVMVGYLGMPEETSAVLDRDGWLRTGDLARREPDGVFTFVGRIKDIIRRRGENLAPLEVEEALASHPRVVEVAVLGVPSDLGDEDVKAFVVLRGRGDEASDADTADTDTSDDRVVDAIVRHAAARLSPFKVPRYVEVVAGLPRTDTGRVAKHRLSRERNVLEHDLGDRTHREPSGSEPAPRDPPTPDP